MRGPKISLFDQGAIIEGMKPACMTCVRVWIGKYLVVSVAIV